MARKKTLHDVDGAILYPNTITDCIYNPDGTNLNDTFGDTDISHIGDGTLTNAINTINRKVNSHNSFSTVKVNNTNITANTNSDTLTIESGTNIDISTDVTNSKIVISSNGVQDNLTSESTTDALSAKQGKVLKELVDGKAKDVHKHTVTDITGLTASVTELNYTDGVTSNIQTQLNSKAPLNSPSLTGTPKAPTASTSTNTTQIATTAFVQSVKSSHDSSNTAHSDIRTLITNLTTRLNALADSDDTTLDQLSEIVAYIKSNRTLIENVTTNKVNVSDIINNLTSTNTNKPLSANQGKVLKGLIDTLTNTVNTKIDGITGDNSHITATTSGTTTTISHNNVTRNNTTSNESPSIGGSFSAISSVTSDNKGHITAVNTKTIKLPAYSTGTASTSGITKLYTGTGNNTDGTITQSVLTNLLNGKAASNHTHTASQINMANGQSAETCLGSIQGITDSRTSTSSNIAFSAAGGKNLQDQISTLNSSFNALVNRISCTVNTSYITPRILNIVPYGKILRFSIDATVNDITTGWHTLISGLPQIRENQHYQLLLINTNGDIGIRDGLFTNTVFNVYLESFDVNSRIIVNSMAHIV